MILEDDFILLEDHNGVRLLDSPILLNRAKALGIVTDWPPPKELKMLFGPGDIPRGFYISGPVDSAEGYSVRTFIQYSVSELTDEQSQRMSHVSRGAVYRPQVEDIPNGKAE